MASVERTYVIPLRKAYQKAPKYRRTKKAVLALRTFLQKHMKSDDIAIGPMLNMKLWENGIQNPPHHVKVVAVKDDKDKVRVELFGFEYKEKKKAEQKKKAAPGLAGKLQEKVSEIKEGPQEEAPKQEAATKKDLKKAAPKPEHPAGPKPKAEKAPKQITPKSA